MINIVWLKRDFRLIDHAPLYYSQQNNLPTLFLYVVETEYWQLPDTSLRQFNFIKQSIYSYMNLIEKHGGYLCIRKGDVVEIFQNIHTHYPISNVFCHQETGNNWTYNRDIRVIDWCKAMGVSLKQYPQQAVFRGKLSRDDWQKKANKWLDSELYSVPSNITSLLQSHNGINHLVDYSGNDIFDAQTTQVGGVNKGYSTLNSFLSKRIKSYLYGISSPVTSELSSSRLSPYIAYGCLSLREILCKAFEIEGEKRNKSGFISRLYWHSHFVQKLETEPRYAIESVHRSLIAMRAEEFNNSRYVRWIKGETGVPFIDACMRMLNTTGWINFRMRAMLVSYSSYHLWLDWPKPAAHLASTFIDYEPGIHYPQVQMQSGTTGINPFRIYNPVTQGQKYDPKGYFIKKYIPELEDIPSQYIHTPWLYSKLKTDKYDKPDMLPEDAAKAAKKRIGDYYKLHIKSDETKRVIKVHASRKRKATSKRKSKKINDLQLPLI